jgi:hypothetical protein
LHLVWASLTPFSLKGKCHAHTLEPAVAGQPALPVVCAPAGDANSAGAGLVQLVEAADLINRCVARDAIPT